MRRKFAEKLVTMVASAHLWHFYTSSYSEHMAFDDYYTSLDALADKYIEADIGVHGRIAPSGTTFYYAGLDESMKILHEFKNSVKAMRDIQEGEEQNGLVAVLEVIMTLIDKTLYKLGNLS